MIECLIIILGSIAGGTLNFFCVLKTLNNVEKYG
jgi:hypothetical protein